MIIGSHSRDFKAFNYISEKRPKIPPRAAYGNAVEFKTMEELDNIATDVDAMRIQSLLICERVLGIHHKDMLFRLMFRYVDQFALVACFQSGQSLLATLAYQLLKLMPNFLQGCFLCGFTAISTLH